MKKIFPVFSICFVLLLVSKTAWTAGSYGGSWTGTTDQGYNVSFTVRNATVTTFEITIKLDGLFCSETRTKTASGQFPINGNSFTISGSDYNPQSTEYDDYEYTCTFNSATSCTGTWEDENTYCIATGNGTWSADTTPPTVSFTCSANNARDVPVNAAITATFSEAMNPLTITDATFLVNDGTDSILGTVSYAATTAKFRPAADLDYQTAYTAVITTEAENLAGNPLQIDYTWSFTTGSAADTTPPIVSSTSTADKATDVQVNTTVTVTFSECMDPTTITAATFLVNDGSSNISGLVTYSDTTAAFAPTAILGYGTEYTTTLTTEAKDLADNALGAEYTWSFTTQLESTPIASGGLAGGCFISTAAFGKPKCEQAK